MSHFCLLRNVDTYTADPHSLLEDEQARIYWLDLFEDHFQATLDHAVAAYGRSAGKHIEGARQDFAQQMALLRSRPDALDGELSVLALCRMRERFLKAHRLSDPFSYIKRRENESSVKLYRDVARRLHLLDPADRWLHLIEAVFAGNIFDLGSPATMNAAYESPDFLAAVEDTKPRPWLVDDFDRLLEDLLITVPAKWGKAVIFVDNAGCDFVLGLMPLARELALEGVQVVLAANEHPSLNDITADETVDMVEQLATIDADLPALIEAGMFEVVSTGTDLPLIDLSDVSDELNAAAEDADLVILEGMGRAVESNLDAQFKVDTLHLALLKNPNVAARLGGEVYDCVCKYKPID